MYPGNHIGGHTKYPTKWALNPTAYENVPADQVDWATLAQQWIYMKETCPPEMVPSAPPPPPITPAISMNNQGEAPMDVDKDDCPSGQLAPPAPTLSGQWPHAGWGYETPSWNSTSAGSWGWTAPVVPAPPPPPAVVGHTQLKTALLPTPQFPGFVPSAEPYATRPTGPNAGYWTAPGDQGSSHGSRSKYGSKMRSMSPNRTHEMAPITLDAAKRKTLPAWLREGLEKMERQKQQQIDNERQQKEKELFLEQKKQAEENYLRDLEKDGATTVIRKSRFDSESEEERDSKAVSPEPQIQMKQKQLSAALKVRPVKVEHPLKSREERIQETMLSVRRILTEILLEVTTEEILTVSQEVVLRARVTAPAQTLRKTSALASLTGGLGLSIYGGESSDSSGSSDEDANSNKIDSEEELEKTIRKRKIAFEEVSREIEQDLAEEEQREVLRQKGALLVEENSESSEGSGEKFDKQSQSDGGHRSASKARRSVSRDADATTTKSSAHRGMQPKHRRSSDEHDSYRKSIEKQVKVERVNHAYDKYDRPSKYERERSIKSEHNTPESEHYSKKSDPHKADHIVKYEQPKSSEHSKRSERSKRSEQSRRSEHSRHGHNNRYEQFQGSEPSVKSEHSKKSRSERYSDNSHDDTSSRSSYSNSFSDSSGSSYDSRNGHKKSQKRDDHHKRSKDKRQDSPDRAEDFKYPESSYKNTDSDSKAKMGSSASVNTKRDDFDIISRDKSIDDDSKRARKSVSVSSRRSRGSYRRDRSEDRYSYKRTRYRSPSQGSRRSRSREHNHRSRSGDRHRRSTSRDVRHRSRSIEHRSRTRSRHESYSSRDRRSHSRDYESRSRSHRERSRSRGKTTSRRH